VHEGEGAQHTVWDGDHELAVPDAPAHYYLFDEIRSEFRVPVRNPAA